MSVASVAAASAATHQAAVRRRTALVLSAGLLVVHFAPTIGWLFDRWTMSVWQHAHGLLIPPVVAWFVWGELRRFRGVPQDPSLWGLPVLAVALALNALDAGLQTQLLSAVALVLALPGLSLLFLGRERTRAIIVPLAFLAFMLPIPLQFTSGLHLALRHVAAAGTGWLLPYFGVPTHMNGLTMQMPSGSLFIADACSGFSTLYAAVAVAFVVAHTVRSWPRRLLVLASAAPLAIGANILRVALLGLLVEWNGPGVLDTWLHPASGMLTFALALPPLFWLGHEPATRAEGVAP
jgi:exosortase